MGGGGEGACVKVSLSVWERARGEGEMLEATGYLSRYNGVSYEKTSVNFLSDLQQCITQSSHSADLLKLLSDRKLPLFAAPNAQKLQLWSH